MDKDKEEKRDMVEKSEKTSNGNVVTRDSSPIIKKGILNPKRTEPAFGEIGTDADVYKYSGLDIIKDTSGLEDEYDEEDDTRLGEV